MATQTEILAQATLKDGAYFTAVVAFAHIPGASLPVLEDVNAALDGVNAGITCDSITQSGSIRILGVPIGDTLANVLSAGTSVVSEWNCHVDDQEESPQGGQILMWLQQAITVMGSKFELWTPNITLVTVGQPTSDSGGILPDGSLSGIPTGLTTSVSLTALAVIAVVALIVYNEVRHAV